MTTYLSTLAMIVTASLLVFSSETEQSRIITIQRPLVITQERKTPAFFVYQQIQKLQEKKRESSAALKIFSTTYLSNLSLAPASIKLAEMKFSKSEFLATPDRGFQIKPPVEYLAARPAVKALAATIIAPAITAAATAAVAMQNLQLPASANSSHANKWATIRGKFELIDGVGITDHHIELKRIEEGEVREVGYIDLKAGLYSIDIESPRGYLIAEIKDRNGLLVGEDRERLVNLQSRGSFYEGPFLRVGQPASVAANPVYSDRAKTDARTAVAASIFDNQNKLEKPDNAYTNISGYSSTISRIFDPSRIYKNITTIRHVGEKTETMMFTTKWAEGVVSYISDIQKIEFKTKNGPIIIGRVLSDGKPVSNAVVQMATALEGARIAPIYFDQFMIPAFSQSATSENGYFMFIGLEPDNYQVVAFKQNAVLGSQMFIAEEDSIAFQNIASQSTPRIKVVRSFDAFTSTPLETDIVYAEAEEALETQEGTATLKTFSQIGISEYLARTSDRQYVPIRYVQNSLQEYVHLPMIQEQWLESIKEFKKISSNSEAGTIVGFSKDLSFDMYLTVEAYSKSNMVYFDAVGNIVSESTEGGGFILFNVPVGAREVIVQDRNGDRIYSQVFNVLAQQVSVAHFNAD